MAIEEFVIDWAPYVVSGYLEDSYYQFKGSEFSLQVSGQLASIVALEPSTLDVSVTTSALSDRTRTVNVVCNAIATVNVTTGVIQQVESDTVSKFTLSCEVTKFNGAIADFGSKFLLNAESLVLMQSDAILSSSFDILVRPISFNTAGRIRPLRPTLDTLTYTYGGYTESPAALILDNATQGRRLEYTTNAETAFPDNQNEFVIEWQSKFISANHNFVIFRPKNTNSPILRIYSTGTYTLNVDFKDDQGIVHTISGPVANDSSILQNIVFVYVPGFNMSLYANGVQIGMKYFPSIAAIPSDCKLLIGGDPLITTDSVFRYNVIDEFRIVKGSNAAMEVGINRPDNQFIRVQTSEYADTPNTRLLLHFNSNSIDDFVTDYSADLTSSSTLDVHYGFIKKATAHCDATFSQVSNGDRVRDCQADLTSKFAFRQAISVGANLTVNTDIDVLPGKLMQTSVALEALTSLTSQISLLQLASASLEVRVTIDTIGSIILTDYIVYVIPQENRSSLVTGEARDYAIHNENRTYTLQGDQ